MVAKPVAEMTRDECINELDWREAFELARDDDRAAEKLPPLTLEEARNRLESARTTWPNG